MRSTINKLLEHIARFIVSHDKRRRNQGRIEYPQLLYYMPHRYVLPPFVARCCVCGQKIDGPPPRGRNSPDMPAPQYWCNECVDQEPNQPPISLVRAYQYERIAQKVAPENRKKALIGYWLRPTLQWLCGILSGHELSKTEWGYGGGNFVDRNCRWCDKQIKVPRQEEVVPHPAIKEVADMLGFNEGNPPE